MLPSSKMNNYEPTKIENHFWGQGTEYNKMLLSNEDCAKCKVKVYHECGKCFQLKPKHTMTQKLVNNQLIWQCNVQPCVVKPAAPAQVLYNANPGAIPRLPRRRRCCCDQMYTRNRCTLREILCCKKRLNSMNDYNSFDEHYQIFKLWSTLDFSITVAITYLMIQKIIWASQGQFPTEIATGYYCLFGLYFLPQAIIGIVTGFICARAVQEDLLMDNEGACKFILSFIGSLLLIWPLSVLNVWIFIYSTFFCCFQLDGAVMLIGPTFVVALKVIIIPILIVWLMVVHGFQA